MRAVVVDDFRLARLDLLEALEHFDEIKVICDTGDSQKALEVIEHEKPEIIFLDINMPKLSGFDIVESLTYTPNIVFTTAYSEFALKSFNYNTVDYLLKPIDASRLQITVDKIFSNTLKSTSTGHSIPDLQPKKPPFMLIKNNSKHVMVKLIELEYIESNAQGTTLYWPNNYGESNKTLKVLEETLPDDIFFRVSRKVIINLGFLSHLSQDEKGNTLATLKNGCGHIVTRRQAHKLKEWLAE